MVQRFGRVNRRATPGRARIEIVPSLSEKDAENEVATERLAELRAPFEAPGWPERADGTRDASPLALARLKSDPILAELIAKAQSPEPYHPALSMQLVESWAMTILRDHPGRPIVAPWLRGWVEQRPQCGVAWRRRFPLRGDPQDDRPGASQDLEAFFDAAPPHTTEVLEAPADRVAEILKKRADAWGDAGHPEDEGAAIHPPLVVVLDVRYDFERLLTIDELRSARADRLARDIADRTLIVDARLGGLAESGLLDAKADAAPPTVDGDEGTWKLPLSLYGQRRICWGARPNTLRGDWRFQGFSWSLDPDDDDAPELWVEVWRDASATAGDAAVTLRAQRLAEHHEWAREEASTIADALGLAPEKKALICAAAGFHDAGKARELWQNAMNASRDDGRPYAKTTGGAAPRTLAGYRHEFGSLADAATNPEIAALSGEDRDLALHLIAAHHGRARPSIFAFDPDEAPSRSLLLAQDVALRYARLQRMWGTWGLAWWEALVRSADWAASRRVNSE
jgi:CRISPR-associated endonuclease/helicase Cas3